jgi:gluconolactonase
MVESASLFRTFASGVSAPEGPVLGPNGWVLNVCSLDRADRRLDTRGGDITATHWTQPGNTKILFNTSTSNVKGIPAALAFGPDECLYVTDEGHRAIMRVSPGGDQTNFITEYRGEPLNGPNDLCFDSEGNLFFSDPWTSSLKNPIGAVYGFDWRAGELHKIDEGMAFSNGVAIRGEQLYVAETFRQIIWCYDIVGDGKAENRREFCHLPVVANTELQGPDGMEFSEDGRLFVAHVGAGVVRVFDGDGGLVDSLQTNGDIPTNVSFVGPSKTSLAVTVEDRDEMILIDGEWVGSTLNFCPSMSEGHKWGEDALRSPAETS